MGHTIAFFGRLLAPSMRSVLPSPGGGGSARTRVSVGVWGDSSCFMLLRASPHPGLHLRCSPTLPLQGRVIARVARGSHLSKFLIREVAFPVLATPSAPESCDREAPRRGTPGSGLQAKPAGTRELATLARRKRNDASPQSAALISKGATRRLEDRSRSLGG